MKKFLMSLVFSAISATSYSATLPVTEEWVEITSTFVPQFIQMSVGASITQPTMTFKSRCLVGLPGGGCLTVEKTKARGTVRISSLTSNSGQLFSKLMIDPITGESGFDFASNLYFNFSYEGQTEAELWKQDTFTGYAWGTLHPRGRIQVWLAADRKSTYKLTYKFEADPNAGDDPNTFMATVVAPQLKPVLVDYVRRILGLPDLIIL